MTSIKSSGAARCGKPYYSGATGSGSSTINKEMKEKQVANIWLDIEKGVEIGASDLLKWITGASNVVTKAVAAEPKVVAALGTLFGALETAVTGASSVASSGGLNIPLDEQELTAVKAIWPDIKAFVTAVVPSVKL